MKRALIIGARGQDGTLLTQRLLREDYVVLGLDRGTVECSAGRDFAPVDILDAASVAAAVRRFEPHEVYYLAAFHHSSESGALRAPGLIWKESFAVNVNGLVNVLEGIRVAAPTARLFYAASSLVFGAPDQCPQTEEVPFRPLCVYGISKTAGAHCCRLYRETYGVFASVGILYNHESHLRPEGFLSKKVIQAAVRIKRGEQSELVVGDLAAESDWGYAPDYVDAMWRILQLGRPDDFIVATGSPHRVQDWVACALGTLGLPWQDHVREDRTLVTRRKPALIGDSRRLRARTGWFPATSFEDMIGELIRLEGASA